MPLDPHETCQQRQARLKGAKQWSQFQDLKAKYRNQGFDTPTSDKMAEAVINDRAAKAKTLELAGDMEKKPQSSLDPWTQLRNAAPNVIAYENDVAAICFELMGVDPMRILETPEMVRSIPSRGTVNMLQWLDEEPENKSIFFTTWARAALKDSDTAKDKLMDDGTAEALDILRQIKKDMEGQD